MAERLVWEFAAGAGAKAPAPRLDGTSTARSGGASDGFGSELALVDMAALRRVADLTCLDNRTAHPQVYVPVGSSLVFASTWIAVAAPQTPELKKD